MSFLTKILGSGAKELAGGFKNIIGAFKLAPEEKAKVDLAIEQFVHEKFIAMEKSARSEIEAKEKILVAELQQGDNFTKRARPTVVYVGLGAVVFNYCVIPLLQLIAGIEVNPFALPAEFWAGWSGIVMTWSIGRSAEKRGKNNKVTNIVTGNKSVRSMLDE
ncbi:MAG: 3TM-type holin [Candidatus Hodarchaeales archaeon]